jgi:hypothetical protein
MQQTHRSRQRLPNGDALLVKGRLKKNRGWIGQNLKVKTDYIASERDALSACLVGGSVHGRPLRKLRHLSPVVACKA